MALELFCFVAIIFGVREQWKEDVGGGGGGRGTVPKHFRHLWNS